MKQHYNRLEAALNYAKLGKHITEKRFNRTVLVRQYPEYLSSEQYTEHKRTKAKAKLDKFLLEQIIGSKNNYYKKMYNISAQEVHDMKIKQNNCCAICGGKTKKTLAVDHCHKTKKVRGLLCMDCNVGLGFFKDNIEALQNAIKYLSS